MAFGISQFGQLGMGMPAPAPAPFTVDDLEAQRRRLQDLGMDEGWLGDVNKWRMDRREGVDQMRDALRSRLLGQNDGAEGSVRNKAVDLAKSAARDAVKQSASSAATGATAGAGMGALGAAL